MPHSDDTQQESPGHGAQRAPPPMERRLQITLLLLATLWGLTIFVVVAY